ncbi:hypothetical protein BGZ63DRAFT_490837 [Mariannaea sp. PMI_226]|nr:hypothetical protein BGZ63DRAFT_490837 [Mariannaea sp. PMI_226]
MASSGSVFSDTLREITDTKLDELSKRRAYFEQARSSLLQAILAEEDAVKRLVLLSNGVKQCCSIRTDDAGRVIIGQTKYPRLERELKNLDRFLDQAKYDPSISHDMLDTWQSSLLHHLDTQSRRFQYASLYGKLVTEWLSSDKNDESTSNDDVEMGEGFEDVGNAKKLESRIEWEKTVFEPADTNEVALQEYLDHLFGLGDKKKKAIKTALTNVRDAVKQFESQISTPDQFHPNNLRWVISSLQSSDLLSNEKREVLKDFEGNDVILKEIADVLNMRIGALDTWTWSAEAPVPVEMHRKISGVYNIQMHEDLLQAIFLEYIGIKWSVFFKQTFINFRESQEAWKSAREDIPKHAKQRLGYYLGPLQSSPCLQSLRSKIFNNKYFLAQLLDNEQQCTETVDGEEEAEYAQFDEEEDDSSDEEDKTRNPIALKKNLLHLLSTEIAINTHIYGELTAFHCGFESWNSMLPHQTVYGILKHFGVSEAWLRFFRKFLEAPLKFIDDDKSTPARKRRRGTPASHVLSEVFGETALFCLDFAVNQSTAGNVLWRVHDDVWFWSPDHAVAVKAWETLDEFIAVTGTEVNPARAGTIRVSKDVTSTLPIDKSLPRGEIRWGFLRLSPKTGKFEIDQAMVDSHIEELHKQLLHKRKSVLDFIPAWNSYAAVFFNSNFGKAANCFGREHVDNILDTHKSIQERVCSLLPQEGETKASSVTEYIKSMISHRFGISDVPDGFLYFPIELGGLDLVSPFISLLQIREQVQKSPGESLETFEQAERDAYERAKKEFIKGNIRSQRYALDDPDWVPESAHDRETFMPFDEYVRYRELFRFDHHPQGTRLHNIFKILMKRPDEQSVDADDSKVSNALGHLQNQPGLRLINRWHSMEPYWRWVTMMHGPEIVDRFGGMNIVEPTLLPMGMVTMFRDKRVTWQG